MTDLLGWVATALFAASYACRRDDRLRLVQAAAAALWIAYGVALGAAPVIVANAVVATIALLSVWRMRASAAAARATPGQGDGALLAPAREV